jgi:pilus assembly protein Flp/PilA
VLFHKDYNFCLHRILGFDRQVPVVEPALSVREAEQEVHHMKHSILKFWSDESGATAIEYCLIAAGIALAIIVIVSGLGSTLADKLTSLNSSLK